MSEPVEDWSEEFQLTAAMVRPERLRSAVETALRARGIQPGLAVMEGIELKSGVTLDFGDELHELKVAVGDLKGAINIYLDGNKARLDFSSRDVEGDFEPHYLLFAELGRALGATAEPLTGTGGVDLDTLEQEIADALEDYAPRAVKLKRLEPVEREATVKVERTSNDLIISVASYRFQTEGGAGLPDSDLEELRQKVNEASLDAVADARRVALSQRPMPADPSRAGGWFLDAYGHDGVVRWSAALGAENLDDALEKVGPEEVAVVTRYFKDGRPFFRSPVDLDDHSSFDDFHLFRTWSWLQGTSS